jgi:stearoyl-CoA desaturase (delta-9 desaturase)
MVAAFVFGEGWHNYHHVFPWDYKAAEFDSFIYNPTTKLIDFFAWIGWAYDLKTVPKSMVLSRMERTGDGTFHEH